MVRWKNIIYPIAAGLITLLLLRSVFFIGYVPTSSMEPAIHENSLLMGIRLFGKLNVRDVVVFEREGQLLVKRIQAIEGMKVEHNGSNILVPEEHFYLIGDNRDYSYDSRFWEEPFIHQDRVVAKVYRWD